MSKAQILDKLSHLLDRVCDMSSDDEEGGAQASYDAQAAHNLTATQVQSSTGQGPAASSAGQRSATPIDADSEPQHTSEAAAPSIAAANSPSTDKKGPALPCPPSARSAALAASAAAAAGAGAALEAADMGIQQRAVESPRTSSSAQLQSSQSPVELAGSQPDMKAARASGQTAAAAAEEEEPALSTPASSSTHAGTKRGRPVSSARNTPGSSARRRGKPAASSGQSRWLVHSSTSANRRSSHNSRPLIGIPLNLQR